MKFFIDTANVDEIREAAATGIICGVTTNPTLVAKEGRDFRETILEITSIVDGPISAEVISLDADGMVKEAEEIAAWHPNIVIKIPMTWEGLKATSRLSKKNIKTNVTLVFNPNQALAAARAGATYVSPFIGRFTDITQDGIELVANISEIFTMYDIPTQIIAASIRTPMDVFEAARAGADIATVPFKVLQQMIKHPLTDTGIEKFLDDWKKVPKK
ncbi:MULTISPECIES: fructose-6-phosphate aldolase [Tepidanaerobacter]|uniref:Probable transaldolase n=1 Tax=Tepidanaerobacter syntrophicus TaxID=224999 RepID=A0A0U9HG32_9FIRM|nr:MULTISPECIES: fructose-6-phosphate aldolase [Tepidanaerobacter]GAQ25792.1 transaldolase [Tepidanaerobacter syntrophicus]GLI20158.1 putative transaldolase [Tepidanaerobacter syntrophicus]GLI50568.1 putative transaldolase [Tepidanaerobacter syntrophicus]HHV82908.1 fructose-6-phosphate aldolase [Tepidanaerobacter syntrophicus]